MIIKNPICPVCGSKPCGTVEKVAALFGEQDENAANNEFEYNGTDLSTQEAAANGAGEILLVCNCGAEWYSAATEAANFTPATETPATPADSIATYKTLQEIQELKRNWLSDPIWDLEETEGFEAHREELLAFRKAKEAEWSATRAQETTSRRQQLLELAEQLGVPGNDQLATAIKSMLNRLDAIESRLPER